MSKIINCKTCNMKISESAKECPGCGAKNKKPFYKKWWVWVVAVIFVILVAANSNNSNNPDNSNSITDSKITKPSKTIQQPSSKNNESKTNDKVPAEYKSALKKATTYVNTMHMSKRGLYDQLTSEYGEKFSQEAAQYAIDNVDADWKANALSKAKTYQDTMAMSPAAIYDQLTSEYGENFTSEEADYAIEHLNE